VPPRANDTSAEVVHFYTAHLTSFRVGAVTWVLLLVPMVIFEVVAFYGLWLWLPAMSLELVKSVNRHYATAS
jgi:hypothetical protein